MSTTIHGGARSAVLAVTMMLLALLAGVGTATAAPSDRDLFQAQSRDAGLSAKQAAGLQKSMDAYLAKFDGRATQVSANTLTFDGGFVSIPAPGEKNPRQMGPLNEGYGSAECTAGARPGWLCVYSGPSFTGARIGMYTCHVTWPIPWSGYTNGSWHNNQTPGTQPWLVWKPGTSGWWMPAAPHMQFDGVNWTPVLNITPC